MSVNDKPCQTCVHYDPILRGDGTMKARHGWCAIRSVYPAQEGPGQVFPPRVKRVEPGALAAPVIVTGADAVPSCTTFHAKP